MSHFCPSILITRAAKQAEKSIVALKQQHWKGIAFPAVEIYPAKQEANKNLFSQLSQFDWLIFISQNAVHHFMQQIGHLPNKLPAIATIGLATSQAAIHAGLPVKAQPNQRFDSEGLLENPVFSQINHQRILIIRGNGGRELLAKTLQQRGAQVSYAQVYERRLPSTNNRDWIIKAWDKEVDIIHSTSKQLLDNLVQLLGNQLKQKLFDTPIIVISTRMQVHAQKLGFKKIWLADGASDDQMIQTIKKHRLNLNNLN